MYLTIQFLNKSWGDAKKSSCGLYYPGTHLDPGNWSPAYSGLFLQNEQCVPSRHHL